MKCTILFGLCTENINGNVTEVKECDERMMDELKEWDIAPEANATTHQQAKHYQSNNNRKNLSIHWNYRQIFIFNRTFLNNKTTGPITQKHRTLKLTLYLNNSKTQQLTNFWTQQIHKKTCFKKQELWLQLRNNYTHNPHTHKKAEKILASKIPKRNTNSNY